jgi:hypothetical protein
MSMREGSQAPYRPHSRPSVEIDGDLNRGRQRPLDLTLGIIFA